MGLRYLNVEVFRENTVDANTKLLSHFNTGVGATATDETGDNNLAITGAEWIFGRMGYGLDFNGSTDYLTAADDDSLKPASALTIDFAIELGSTKAQVVVCKSNESTQGYIVKINANNKIEFILYNGASATTLTSDTALVNGVFTHVACTWDSNTMKIYINGSVEETTQTFSGLVHSTNTLYVGCDNGASGNFLDGKLDEFRISDTARTSFYIDEIPPLGPMSILQPNSRKLGSAGLTLFNVGDALSWITPNTHLGVYAGSSEATRTKIFGGRVREPKKSGGRIYTSAKDYAEELQRTRLTTNVFDKEATDLIKDTILAGTDIILDDISFVGLETTRTGFHSDSYADESNIESKSNVSLAAGVWDLDKDADDPVDKELGTENEANEWGSTETLTVGNSTDPKHTGDYATSLGDTARDSFTDDEDAEFDGDLTNMVAVNDRLEMDEAITEQQLTTPSGVTTYDIQQEIYLEEGEVISKIGIYAIGQAGVQEISFRLTRLGADVGGSTQHDTSVTGWFYHTLSTPHVCTYTGKYHINYHKVSGSPRAERAGDVYRGTDYCIWRNNVEDTSKDMTFKVYALLATGNYVSSEKDAGASNQWATMDINSNVSGSVVKLYTDSNDDQDWGAPSWTLRATITGGNQVDIDISAENGRYFKYKVDVESIAEGLWVTDIDMHYGTTGAAQIRQGYYPTAKNWAKDLSGKFKWNFWFYSDTTEDLEVRMYTSAGNYFHQVLPVDAADTWEQHIIALVRGTWSEQGSPSWSNINWLEFYISAAKARTISYVDEQYFDAYKGSGNIVSVEMNTVTDAGIETLDYFDDAKLDTTKTTPAGTSLTLYGSNDSGITWDELTEETWGQLTDHHSDTTSRGRYFQYKIIFTSDGTSTPTLSTITIDVKTKKITVYSYRKYEAETRWDALGEILKEADLEGYVDVNQVFQLDHRKDTSSPTGSEPYLREKHEIMSLPSYKQSTYEMINKQEVRGADEGAKNADELDKDLTEQKASSWTETTCSISDESGEEYVKEGIFCIRVHSFAGGSGWTDDCGDGSINPNYWEIYTEAPATVTETTFIRAAQAQNNQKPGFFYFHETGYPLTGDFDISFKFRTSVLGRNICTFVTNPPQTYPDNDYKNLDGINTHADGELSLHIPSIEGTRIGQVSANTWFTIRIVRVGATHTIYVEGEQVWTGSLDDADHDNIEFGNLWTSTSTSPAYNLDYDDFTYGITSGGGNALSPPFSRNLDRRENLFCWYRQDGSSGFEIRLETDASNYFSRYLTPQEVNETYKLRLPVGSKSSGWSSTGSPDWTHITRIRFVYASGSDVSIVYVDKLHFTISPVEYIHSDSISIADNGTYEGKRIIDKQLTLQSECEKRAKKIVELCKNVLRPMEIQVYGRSDINVGGLVKVLWSMDGINDEHFRVDEIRHDIFPAYITTLSLRDIAEYDFAAYLKRLDKETKQI